MLLRRKLVIVFGSLVALLLAMSVGAIWLLQGILGDLHHMDREAWVVTEESNNLGTTISLVEIELYELELGRTRHLDPLLQYVELLDQQLAQVERSYVARVRQNAEILSRIRSELGDFARDVAMLATAQDATWSAQRRKEALATAVTLRQDILALNHAVRLLAEREQSDITSRFRWLVLGLTLVFLLVINVAVIVLLRMAGMVLRPVEKLVEATRQLAQERFDCRVVVDQNDEFDELARAYNHLASQLQQNEQRRLEMIGQVALTLNHELNNVAAIIELQLKLLSRHAAGNPEVEKHAKQIHESLNRMTRTVEALKRVRRIVLTDYISGVKMLDLERSVEDAGKEPAAVQAEQRDA